MDLGLKGRPALVGGASKGLGRAAARALLLEGAEVMIAARSKPALDQTAASLAHETGRVPLVCAADLTRAADRERCVREAESRFGRLDILVANAGGPPTGPFEAHGDEAWELALDLSLRACVHLARLVLPGMKARRFGRIVQIASIAGLEAMDGLILSNACRPAVLGFGKALAREAAPHNVLVNSICPGIFLTDRVREIAAAQALREGIPEDQALSAFASDIPLGRPGKPEELGDLVAFLCSARNTYLTGAAIPIDGGRTRRLV
jgi:3-oxoacyl-[acyl-carrier protein] reductase